MFRKIECFFLVVLIACAGFVQSAELEIPLTVTESAGTERLSEPVSGGIPLPRGKFRKDQSFALFKDGKEIPCQVSPLVVETDDTLRWVLLDFQDDFKAKASNTYKLKPGKPGSRPKVSLKVDDGPEGVTVNTGRITFTVSRKKPFSLFDSVKANGRTIVAGGEVSYIQMQGRAKYDDNNEWKPRTMTAGPPDSVKLVYAGPLRATVEVRGGFKDDPLKMQYKAWITAWAGKSSVYVKYKLCNSNPEQFCVILISRATIRLDINDKTDRIVLGAEKPIETDPGNEETWIHQGLHPGTESAARAGSGDKQLWAGNGFPGGWIAACTGTSSVFVCDRLFFADPARKLSADRNSIRIESVAEAFKGKGRPWRTQEGRWLIDCSHLTSEYLLDFSAPADGAVLDRLAKAGRRQLHARASGTYYSECEALSIGRFGTVEGEKACYDTWGQDWKQAVKGKCGIQPHCKETRKVDGVAFVRHVSNHGDSEGDSTEGTLLMYLRSGNPGWWEYAQAWARYHADLHVLRTDGWKWKEGECHFRPGMRGCSPKRKNFNFIFGKPTGRHYEMRKFPTPAGKDLAAEASSQMCGCHFYGTGLADYYCLTGDRDALDALVDNIEMKIDVWGGKKKLHPGKSKVGGERSFTRGLMVVARASAVLPGNMDIAGLCRLMTSSMWQAPILDERGAHLNTYRKRLPPKGGAEKAIKEHGLEIVKKGNELFIYDPKTGAQWQAKGDISWQNVYGQTGADICARYFDDEDMRDYTIGFAQFSAKYMLECKSRQVLYYAKFDVTEPDGMYDWSKKLQKGGYRGGYYTRFFTDVIARGFSWTGEKHLLEKAKEFWLSGACADGSVQIFATHVKSNHDDVLHGSRLLYHCANPRKDSEPPAAVTDLKVELKGDGAEVTFTAPVDKGGGVVARYQVKCSSLPILPYEEWSRVRDLGKKRNWWKAVNLKSEPKPGKPGTKEIFTVTGVPAGAKYFAVRSFDGSWNRSKISNVAEVGGEG